MAKRAHDLLRHSYAHNRVPRYLQVASALRQRLDTSDGQPAAGYVFLRSMQTRGKKPYALARVHVARDIYALAPRLFTQRVALALVAELAAARMARAHQTLTIGTADLET